MAQIIRKEARKRDRVTHREPYIKADCIIGHDGQRYSYAIYEWDGDGLGTWRMAYYYRSFYQAVATLSAMLKWRRGQYLKPEHGGALPQSLDEYERAQKRIEAYRKAGQELTIGAAINQLRSDERFGRGIWIGKPYSPYSNAAGMRQDRATIYCLSSQGSIMIACPTCGAEHFREDRQLLHPEYESCLTCKEGGAMIPMRIADLDTIWKPLWRRLGWKIKGEDY